MNKLRVFNSEEFGEIRTVSINGEPWFVGKDVAGALGYKNTKDALATHVDNCDKIMGSQNTTPSIKDNMGREQYPTWINESGLYALIFGSKLESAKRFKHWVTSEVLPSIRKHGGYIDGQETMSDDELLAKALMVAQNKIAEKNRIIAQKQERIDQMQPKEVFADAVSTSKQSILIGDLAKLICQNGYQIGQKRLFQWMRENGYLMTQGSSYNRPKQRYVEQGLFEIKESTINNPDGSVRITITPKVTGKGQVYFVNKFLGGSWEVRHEEIHRLRTGNGR